MTPPTRELADELAAHFRRAIFSRDTQDLAERAIEALRSAAQPAREPAYCGDGRKIEVSMAAWDGIIHYLKALHKEGAVDDTKMKFAAYFPLEHCMQLWGIEPYKVQHDPSQMSSTECK